MNSSFQKFPTESSDLYLTDGGLETTLVFLEGFDLPCFAAFDLLKEEKGIEALRSYYRRFLEIAANNQTNFILESPTWRTNPDWLKQIGYSPEDLLTLNQKAIQLMQELKEEYSSKIPQILISGCLGPRGDGYQVRNQMDAKEAKSYHAPQIMAFSKFGVDLVSAITMTNVEEAHGIAQAASDANIPCVISFTLETDGKLPSGMPIQEAITLVDHSDSVPPIYYMINCAHPDHFMDKLIRGKEDPWIHRIRGIRANASCKSHEELDNSTELDRGNPADLGLQYREIKEKFPHMTVFGGCCGTDEEHVKEIILQVKTVS
ncbi:homocysteine S-methyltransferase [Algoriphagus lacus]|uniref:Homocysteine S-methyltransferase n=1 Tax=Algoriphagus lacus TaxID=2056311 RepID=A0A418PNX3_9BACT|nr:homocysteine S-methyltransferase family protein [Algoriphagus lacus]RIW13611.1 homocysteine S-methyltransferase [Algoriphagus lacus]